MSFRARFGAENASKFEYTLKITMTIEEWERLRDQLDQTQITLYETSQLKHAITDILAQVRKIFWPTTPEEP